MDKKISALVFSLILLFVIHLLFPFVDITESYTDFCIKASINPDDFNVYVINLDRNENRMGMFLREYGRSDINFKEIKRIAAVDGKTLDITQYVSDRAFKEIKKSETTGYRTKHYQLTRGAIGCYLSHLKVYKHISESNVDWGLVFEDDVAISKNFYVKLNNILSKIPNNWDILLLGCHCQKCKKHDIYSDVQKFILMHCYIIKKASALELFNKLNSKSIEQQIDSELSDMLMKSDKFNVFCVNDALSWQANTFKTEIQMPIKTNMNSNDSLLL